MYERIFAPKAKIFAILFENNLVLRKSQQSLVKRALAFSQPEANPLFLILELEVQFQCWKGSDLDRGPRIE